ncbi:MAG: hypothetical protein ACLRWM_04270 [Streptococcus sp.]
MDGILSIVKRNCEIVNYQQQFGDFSEYFKDLGIDRNQTAAIIK